MNQKNGVYSKTYQIMVHEAGPDGRASFSAIANILQDIAARHADELGWSRDNLLNQGLAWVLGRQYVRILRTPRLREDILVHTWPSGYDKYGAYRDFRVTDAAGEDLLLCTSMWLILDVHERHMTGLPDHFLDGYPETPGRILEFPTRAVRKCPVPDQAFRTRALRLQQDMNGHINNTWLTAWCLESVAAEDVSGRTLREVDVSFRNECLAGDELTAGSAAKEQEPGQFLMTLRRESDDAEIARAWAAWSESKI